MAEISPDVVIACGLAAGRAGLSMERFAANWVEAPIPDNDGVQAGPGKICDTSPAGFATNLPLGRMQKAARAVGVPTEISATAGSYACNYVFFNLMREIQSKAASSTRGGFIHLPLSPTDDLSGRAPTMSTEVAARGLYEVAKSAMGTEELGNGGNSAIDGNTNSNGAVS